ncbi:hypothetical protein M408DRAFT_11734 [Serendipita vermifera MAFF 305830]|uniref:DUF300-domain-containing protein n=1 Tax=Serendipita vermifera MAFF 305830 TaxID=933852 RepID=A0A0C2W9N3_SERVB|nr:hypothetical protein M408DRAFT_11734 [Serendipita vermifera MAFF 305830]
MSAGYLLSLLKKPDHGSGSGSALHPAILITAGIAAFAATVLATFSIWLQLKNYRRPILQRQVIRIMLMIPLYAISSFISLFSLEAAVVIDALRDIYESFVIYCFFHLLLDYLGGERSLLILLHGRPPKHQIFPVSLFKAEIDVSDPFTFLFLKRGILQYVQIKPVLAVVTLILKATNTYREGDFRTDAGYLYVSIIYNISIFVALYCLAVFWMVINDDVKPFRPMPKFLCIKGILFFCFWQSIFISLLVSLRVITHVGPYTDVEHISIAISDVLICYEMPFFAVAHMYAFSHTDYIDPLVHYAARMRFWYAVRDGFGLMDVVEDSRATLHSTANYRTYEPVEGGMHVGVGRDRRIRAGLRYAKGGTQKYWLPMPEDDEVVAPAVTGPLAAISRRWDAYQGYAPLAAEEAAEVVHEGFTEPDPHASTTSPDAFSPDYMATDEDDLDLRFDAPDSEVEALYAESRKLVFGDYNYPVVDVSTEAARIKMWDEEERILSNERSAAWSWRGGRHGTLAYAVRGGSRKGYGATDATHAAAASTSAPKVQVREYKNGKGPEDLPHPAIIDYSNETVPDIDINGIRLHWTKSGAPVPGSPSASNPASPPAVRRSTSNNSKKKISVSTPSRPSPTKLKSGGEEPRPEHVPDPENPDHELVDEREDAVDLVVEDRHAGELEMEWERRRGEPALAGASGLKKVFRRKYNAEDSEGHEGEVEIEEARHVGEEPNQLPDKVRMKVKDGPNKSKSTGLDVMSPATSGSLSPWSDPTHEADLFVPGQDTEIVISRETQPPPHAVLEVKETPSVSPGLGHGTSKKGARLMRDSEDEHNPWA